MSRKSDLGPLPMNWRDVFQSLYNIQTTTERHEDNSSPVNKRLRDIRLLSLSCGRLIRCGQLCPHHDRGTIGSPGVIINLRYSNDAEQAYHPSLLESKAVELHHLPAENSLEKYDTSNREVAKWIAFGLQIIQDAPLHAPILVHCRSGRDRTGVLVAAALLAIGIEASLVKSEFLISTESDERWIDQAIEGLIGKGIQNIDACNINRLPWLRGVDVHKLKCVLLREFQNDGIKEGNISWSKAVIDDELAYLRQQNQVFEQHMKSLLERKNHPRHHENTESEIIFLCRINDISTRQIFLLSLKRDIFVDEHRENDNRTKNISLLIKMSKGLALLYARRGLSFKLLQHYEEALSDFTAAVKEAKEIAIMMSSSEVKNGVNSSSVESLEEKLLPKWETQMRIISELLG